MPAVPMMAPVPVRSPPPAALGHAEVGDARLPSASKRMFDGFKSR